MVRNNPSKLAFDEVLPRHEEVDQIPIQLLLNIGTGNSSSETKQDGGGGPRGLRRYLAYILRSLSDNYQVENEMERLAAHFDQDFYYRLNVPVGLQNIDMDEWKMDGSTLATMEAYTSSYLAVQETQIILDDLARQLVHARISRQHFWTLARRQVIADPYRGQESPLMNLGILQ